MVMDQKTSTINLQTPGFYATQALLKRYVSINKMTYTYISLQFPAEIKAIVAVQWKQRWFFYTQIMQQIID